MAKLVKKSAGPIYIVAAVWLVFGLLLPLTGPVRILACAILSFVGYSVAKVIFKDKVIEIPDPKPEPKTTGNKEIDDLIAERERAVSEMHRLNDNIADETISSQIDRLEEDTKKIIGCVVEKPEKLPQIRKFLNYYLPTTLKLLNAYDRMDSAGIAGENIDATKTKVQNMLGEVVKAFDRQLDALFGDEAMDISTDITVMENMLKQEGMSGLQL